MIFFTSLIATLTFLFNAALATVGAAAGLALFLVLIVCLLFAAFTGAAEGLRQA